MATQLNTQPTTADEIARRHYAVMEIVLNAAARHGITLPSGYDNPRPPAPEAEPVQQPRVFEQ